MKVNVIESAWWLLLIAALTLLVFCGCEPVEITNGLRPSPLTPNPSPLAHNPFPPLDLPKALRQHNYSGGSCVHAAMIDCLNWQGKYKLAAWWRKTYRGGEGLDGLAAKADRAGLDFAYTGKGDAGFLQWVSRTRRGAVIFYYSNHAVTFCGFNRGDAVLMNNNHPGQLVRISKNTFLTRWRGYGGVGLTPVYSPAPPRPWIGG